MDSKSLELKIMSCKDLKAFNFFQKLLVYVLVSLASDDPDKKLKQNQQQRTPTDPEGDENPEWNHKMQFDLSEVSLVDCDNLFIHFYLRHEGLYFGDKTIGEVRVCLKDLIQDSGGILRFMSYQVRTPDGKPNGVLNFSYKVHVKGEILGIHFPTSEITGYSGVVHHHHQPSEIHYTTSVAESSSPGVQYPLLEVEDIYQETYPAAQVSYPSYGREYSSSESHYPPAPHAFNPPLLSLRPPPLHQPLLPPAHGAFYHLPYRPEFCPWAPGSVYNYRVHRNSSQTGEQSCTFGNGET